MKNNILKNRIVYFLLPLIILGSSCKKELGLTPTDSIDATKAFRNMTDINMGVIGAYAVLSYSDITNTSLVSDEAMLPTENGTGGGVATHRWQYDGSSGTITADYSNNYVAIDRINRVLKALETVPVLPGESALKTQYTAELLALRAFCHFELIRNFASKYDSDGLGVPYMAESVISKPSRLSVGETVAKIKADLVSAKSSMPATTTDKSRITLKAISAIQARVALYEKNWAEAVTYSTEAIAAIPLASLSQFPLIWTDKGDAEVFWKLRKVTADDGLIGNFYFSANNVNLYAPSSKLMNLFDQANDIRFNSYIKIDNTRGVGKHPNIVVKYVGGSSIKNLADQKLYRTGEMYLIRAEANAELNKLGEAANDLNALRLARITGYTAESFASKEDLIGAIMNERFKELAFEGHRFFDLRRRNLNVTRNPEDAVNALGAILLTPKDAQYAFPIPDSELKANKNMEPNPYY